MKSPSGLTDQELVFELDGLARREREALPHFLACLSEVERRGLHLDLGHHNLFDYCVGRLKFSEGAAMRRIQSARAAAKHAEIYAYLRDGELNLGVVALLAPHLSSDNASSLLDRARGKSKREIETLVVELAHAKAESKRIPPKMEQCEQNELTFLPGESAPAPPNGGVSVQEIRPRRDAIRLESPGVLKIVFRAGPSFREKLERVRGLLGRRGGRLEEILDAVLEDYLNRRDPSRRKIPARRGPAGPRSRRVPRWVRDRVWRRDEGRCAFTAPDGTRCAARSRLEYDHIMPWALGGASDDPGNIRLLCRAHNMRSARSVFGGRVPGARAA